MLSSSPLLSQASLFGLAAGFGFGFSAATGLALGLAFSGDDWFELGDPSKLSKLLSWEPLLSFPAASVGFQFSSSESLPLKNKTSQNVKLFKDKFF
jgi:hypothetical protein